MEGAQKPDADVIAAGEEAAEDLPRGNNQILGVHLGHQEVERVVQGMDIIFEFLPPMQWMSDEAVSKMLCDDLGYEDIPEFEDALRGTFADFLKAMPHIEWREPEVGEEGGLRFRIKELPPLDQRIPTKWVYRINSTKDLWRVCLKSPTARIFIPELEFEIAADGQRHVDAVYNHIAAAIWNLGAHVDDLKSRDGTYDTRYRIMETAAALNIMLDVEKPWTIIMHDPDGLSTFKPEGEEDGSVMWIRNPAPDDTLGMEQLGAFEGLVVGPEAEAEAEAEAEPVG